MSSKKTLLVLLAALVLVLGGGAVAYRHLRAQTPAENLTSSIPQTVSSPLPASSEGDGAPSEAAPDEDDRTAPDFTVYDRDGGEVTLHSQFGQPIVLNFWASWCGPCQLEMPDFQTAYETHGEDIRFLMVNITDGGHETVEKAAAFASDYSFPVYYDLLLDAADTYAVDTIPRTFFIDADGNLAAYAVGTLDAELLAQGIEMIAAGE